MVKNKKTTEKKVNKKKELENKSEEHVVEVDTVETVNQMDDDLTNRINMLYGDSASSGQPLKEYDPKELAEVRKKLILLLIGLVIFVVVAIVVVINPFDVGKNNKTDDKENKPVQEEKPDEEEIPLGAIDLSEPIVVELNDFVSFSYGDFQRADLFPLYTSNLLEANNIPNDIKMFFVKRHNSFLNLLNGAGIKDYVGTCAEGGINISKDDFDKVVTGIFGPDATIVYDDINYSYYIKDEDATKITMIWDNDHYILKCNNYMENSTITKFVQQELYKAIKVEEGIEIYQSVVFINPTGVYKDPNFSELITNDVTATFDQYIKKGGLYKYTFAENGEDYYLSKIEKVLETNEQ